MRARPTAADVAFASIALLVTVWSVLGATAEMRLRVLLLAVPLGVGLAVARRWPIPAVGLALAALFVTDGAGDDSESAFLLALITACFAAGRYARLVQLPWVGAVTLLMVSGTLVSAETLRLSDAIFPVLFTAGPCLVGLAIQLARRRERDADVRARLLDEMREEEVRRASVEERLRIARELHDLVAHDISALSLQAQVARRGAEAGRPADPAALLGIEQTAQRAMLDIRRLLGLLREADGRAAAPAPSLEDVDALMNDVRAIGQDVTLVETGARRPLPPAVSQAAYRIIQEALTNARRHAASAAATVELEWGASALDVSVSNPLRAAPADVVPGHGLLGIGHRAEMFGGTANVGPTGDEWRVVVRLPLAQEVA